MNVKRIDTKPFLDQKPGTSGLRKKATVFQQTHYLENYVQSIFNAIPDVKNQTLVLGGDGRYLNAEAIQTIIRMSIANGWGKIIIGQDGILSTPAASHLIRTYQALGGIILSASHNPAGPDGDFGIKYNTSNGGPAPEGITNLIYKQSQQLSNYVTTDTPDVDLASIARHQVENCEIIIINSVDDYANLMQSLFDFDLIATRLKQGQLSLLFDAMHAVTGPYAKHIFETMLGCNSGTVINAKPLLDFGGKHPDPNLAYAKQLVEAMFSADAPTLGAASDGDGDRNMILGAHIFVNPSDSLACMCAHADLIPGYRGRLTGVARSMPTSQAVDHVAHHLGIPCYETPTGWKFFGSLLDAGLTTLCGEESFGTGSDHVREKDGLWAVLYWLNLIAVKQQSVQSLMLAHWQKYGRNYYQRHDYDELPLAAAEQVMESLQRHLTHPQSQRRMGDYQLKECDDFSYQDPVDQSTATQQGLRFLFTDGSRIVFRLSGTGTQGATLRIYLERYEQDKDKLALDPNSVLQNLVTIANELCQLEKITGRTHPSVIT